MPARRARVALVLIDAFAALTATGGGLALVAGLEGSRLPAHWLAGTPFDSYILPGLILAIVIGGGALVAAAAALVKWPAAVAPQGKSDGAS